MRTLDELLLTEFAEGTKLDAYSVLIANLYRFNLNEVIKKHGKKFLFEIAKDELRIYKKRK
jgi:hypothetical protein